MILAAVIIAGVLFLLIGGLVQRGYATRYWKRAVGLGGRGTDHRRDSSSD